MEPTTEKDVDIASKTDAQKRANQIRHFQVELEHAEREKIIALTEEQRTALTGYHNNLLAQMAAKFDVDTSQRSKQLSWGMRIASFLGALALAASIFYLFNQFWGRLATTTQVVILIISPVLGLIATIYTRQREDTGYFSKLLALVSFACFVLNLSMLGRIFNITPSDNAFLVWAAFGFFLAYAIDAGLLLAAGIICLAGFLSARMGTWSGCYWIYFGQRPENFFPVAILLFSIPFLWPHKRFSGFDTVYRVFAMLLFLIPILILSNWGVISHLPLTKSTIEAFYQTAGFIFSAGLIWLGLKKNWPDTVNTGNVFFVIFLYTKFFDWWWKWMPKYLFFLIIGLTAILALLIFKRLRRTGIHTAMEAVS